MSDSHLKELATGKVLGLDVRVVCYVGTRSVGVIAADPVVKACEDLDFAEFNRLPATEETGTRILETVRRHVLDKNARGLFR